MPRKPTNKELPLIFTEVPALPVKTVSIDPEMAKLILEQYKYHAQRPLRPLEVARYARLMKLGRWNVHEIRICTLGENKYLTDGQHRLNAVVVSGETCLFDLKEIPCSNESEVARDYNSNGGGIPRTQADELRATGIEERLNVSSNYYSSYAAAVRVINTEFSPAAGKYLNSKDTKDIEQRMIENDAYHLLYLDAITGAHSNLRRILKWAGVVAVGIITFKINPEGANEFWRAIASGDTKFPPAIELERQLLPFLNGKRPSQVHIARMVAFYWMRFNEKPYIKPNKKLFQGVDEPMFIYGSKIYTGQQILDPVQLRPIAVKVR